MISRALLLLTVVLIFAGSFWARDQLPKPSAAALPVQGQCRRIVSMAPSLTETLYALGLGDRVVGVTDFCDYPPEAKRKTKVGGYLNPNYEAILKLNPDLLILLEGHVHSMPVLQKLGLRTHVVCHRNVDGILDSIRSIARVCRVEARGRELARNLEERLQRVQKRTQHVSKPRVLMVIERTLGSGRLSDVYIAGGENFYEKMLTLAGGKNVYCGSKVAYPVVSSEGILHLNPDVIIDLVPCLNQRRHNPQEMLADWDELSGVSAVKTGRVYLFDTGYASVPGPRLIHTVEDLARLLHPELFPEAEDSVRGKIFSAPNAHERKQTIFQDCDGNAS